MPEGLPLGLDGDEGELDEDPPLEGEGMPPEVLGDPGLPPEGELGTGMLGELGCVMTDGVRQPVSSTAPPRVAIAVRNVTWTFI